MSLKIRFAALALLLCSACATVSPRFSPEIAESFAHDEMRRMETKSLVVYYPAHAKEPTLQTLARLEKCAETLRGMSEPRTKRPKLVILVTSAEFNNAYVEAQAAGSPTQMVIPVQMGEEVFNFFDFGVTNIGDIACHESVHYVQLEHTEGFWKYVNLVFGDVASPNLGTETWFLEGLATYFEGHLGIAAGRPHSPLWNGMYDSGVAAQGYLQAGQLSPENRELYPFGGNYLAGSHFIGWLAKTYGEAKLWKLIDVQGRSIFFPFGVTLRVKSVYGLSLGALLDEYNKALSVELGQRRRPADQQVLSEDQGYFARLASGPSGELASITVGLEHISRLEVREPDGSLRFSTPLVQLLPIRPYISTSPTSASGLSFTADGRWLYVFFEDVASNSGSTYAVRQYDAHTGRFERSWKDLRGLGGSVLPDGSGYIFVEIHDGIAELARLDFASGRTTLLTHLGSRDPLGAPTVSPDGARIAFSRFEHGGFNLYLREADGTIRPLIRDGRFNYGARWINVDQLLLERETDSGQSQAFVLDLPSGQLIQQTHAPFAVFDPVPAANGRIVFLNREGWKWTLDSAPLLTAAKAPAECTQAAVIQPPEVLPQEPVSKVTIESNQRYSMLDELFIPRLRYPTIGFTAWGPGNHFAVTVGAALMGFDRLGLNTWAINAGYDSFTAQPYASVAYGNSKLAPWFLSASLSRAVARSRLFAANTEFPQQHEVGSEFITDWVATVSASRPFWTTHVSLAVSALQRQDDVVLNSGDETTSQHIRLIGPSASLSWFAGANTPYAGTRTGIAADLSGSAYPKAFGSDFNVADLRAAFTGWIPLPVLLRQSFSLGVRGRWVPGTIEPLLQLGGVSSGYAWALRGTNLPGGAPPDLLLPPTIAFVEPLRGFDDVAFQVKAAAIVSARYRYPFIIDRGTMSFLYILPSFFMRQIDVEGFFDGARTDEPVHNLHGAAGAAIRFRTLWGSVLPISLYYQYAYRFDPGFGSQHVVGLTFD